jgi:hypothetical protein
MRDFLEVVLWPLVFLVIGYLVGLVLTDGIKVF